MVGRDHKVEITMAQFTNRRWRACLAGLLGVALASLLLLSTTGARAQQPDAGPVNLDVILLIDNSMSMSEGEPPSDPEGLRVRAARFLVDYLWANAETAGANYRVGVVSFGGVVSDVIPLRLVGDEAVRDGIRAEEIEYTDFQGSLEYALREFRAKSFDTGNRTAVILLTDGRPNPAGRGLTDVELEAYFADLAPLVRDLEEGGAALYVLGIGDAQEDRENWTGLIPDEHYVPISTTT
jgi:hypothetical protein